MITANETFGARLLSIHNIYFFLHQIMKNIRINIKNGTMKEYRDEFVKNYYGESMNKWIISATIIIIFGLVIGVTSFKVVDNHNDKLLFGGRKNISLRQLKSVK